MFVFIEYILYFVHSTFGVFELLLDVLMSRKMLLTSFCKYIMVCLNKAYQNMSSEPRNLLLNTSREIPKILLS